VKPERDPHNAPRGPPCPNPEPRSDRGKLLHLVRLVDLDQRTLLHRKAQQRDGFRRATDADITARHAPAKRHGQLLDARHVNTDARSGSDRDRGIGVVRLDRKVDPAVRIAGVIHDTPEPADSAQHDIRDEHVERRAALGSQPAQLARGRPDQPGDVRMNDGR
jgi:hypothetical protein